MLGLFVGATLISGEESDAWVGPTPLEQSKGLPVLRLPVSSFSSPRSFWYLPFFRGFFRALRMIFVLFCFCFHVPRYDNLRYRTTVGTEMSAYRTEKVTPPGACDLRGLNPTTRADVDTIIPRSLLDTHGMLQYPEW